MSILEEKTKVPFWRSIWFRRLADVWVDSASPSGDSPGESERTMCVAEMYLSDSPMSNLLKKPEGFPRSTGRASVGNLSDSAVDLAPVRKC